MIAENGWVIFGRVFAILSFLAYMYWQIWKLMDACEGKEDSKIIRIKVFHVFLTAFLTILVCLIFEMN